MTYSRLHSQLFELAISEPDLGPDPACHRGRNWNGRWLCAQGPSVGGATSIGRKVRGIFHSILPTEKELLDHDWTIVFDLPSNGNSRHITLISRVTKSALFISGLPTIENESDDAFMCNRSIGLARGRSRLVRLQSAGEPNSGHGCTAAATTARRIKRGLA